MFKCFCPLNWALKFHFYGEERQCAAGIVSRQEIVSDLPPNALLGAKPNGNSFPFLLINIPSFLVGLSLEAAAY